MDKMGWWGTSYIVRGQAHLNYCDGRVMKVGKTMAIPDKRTPISMCNYGMHAGLTPASALHYSKSGLACHRLYRVRVNKVKEVTRDRKMVGFSRRAFWFIKTKDLYKELYFAHAEAMLEWMRKQRGVSAKASLEVCEHILDLRKRHLKSRKNWNAYFDAINRDLASVVFEPMPYVFRVSSKRYFGELIRDTVRHAVRDSRSRSRDSVELTILNKVATKLIMKMKHHTR